MRIPITTGDWPANFNSIAKYIGRHWPTGKLTLSDAQERAAKLFGYNSVHDVKAELSGPLPQRGIYSTSTMASSMAVKAVLFYDANPVAAYHLFSTMPWSNLDVWTSTSEYELKHRRSGRPLFITDEFHHYANYVTPALIAKAYADKKIPPYKFTITHNGEMYHQGAFEQLLDVLEPSQESLTESGSPLSVEEYFEKNLLPLAFGSIEEIITRLHPEKPIYWVKPGDIDIKKTNNGQYALFNSSVCAYYPGTYSAEQLVQVIKKLFLLEVVADTSSLSEVPVSYVARRGDPKDKMMRIGDCGHFTHNGQVFYPDHAYADYNFIRTSPFINFVFNSLHTKHTLDIPGHIIAEDKLKLMDLAASISKGMMNTYALKRKDCSGLDMAAILSSAFGSAFYDDGSIIDENTNTEYLEPESDRDQNADKRLAYSDFFNAVGQQVFEKMPELKRHHSQLSVGVRYFDRYLADDVPDSPELKYQIGNITVKRNVDFYCFLVSDHLCKVQDQYAAGFAFRSTCWIFNAIANEVVTAQQTPQCFSEIMRVFNNMYYDLQLLEKVESYCKLKQPSPSDEYINMGEPYTPVVSKSANSIHKNMDSMMKEGRKYSLSFFTKPIGLSGKTAKKKQRN